MSGRESEGASMFDETTSATPLEDLERRRTEALAMGGEERIARLMLRVA